MDRFRLWLFSLFFLIAVAFLFRFSAILKLFLFAVGAAYIINPAVNAVERLFICCRIKWHPNQEASAASGGCRTLAVLLVMVGVFLLVGILGGIGIPYVSRQMADFIQDFPTIRHGIQEWLGKIDQVLAGANLPTSLTEPLNNFLNQMDKYLVSGAVSIVSWLAQLGSGVINGIIVFILQIYFLLDGPRMIRVMRDYLLENRLNRIAEFFRKSTQLIKRYIKAQVMISGCMALAAFLGLKIIGLHYASLSAILLFLFDFIPYIGSISATVILILFALFTVGMKTAIIAGIFLFILQQLEGNVLAPKIQGNMVGVHPAFIMLSLLVCFELWGPIGSLFSVLVAGMVKILLKDAADYLLHPELDLPTFLADGYQPAAEDETVLPSAQQEKTAEE